MSHNIAQALREQLKDRQFDYGDTPAHSVMEFLYIAYSEISKALEWYRKAIEIEGESWDTVSALP